MFGVLDRLERTREKEKGEVADEKVNCRKSRVLFGGCLSIFYNDREFIFIPHANKDLADHGKLDSNLKNKIYI